MLVPARWVASVGTLTSVGIAFAMRRFMDPLLGEEIPYETFYLAVAFSARYGGLGSGIVATILGGMLAAFFFIPPEGFAIGGSEGQLGFGMYALVSGGIVHLTESQRQARLRAESSLRLAEEHRLRLQDEMAERQRAQTAETVQRQWLEVTLGSIGDAVIATDTEHRVIFMNSAAVAITSWPATAAIGEPLETVFDVRDELTDAPIENPGITAVREGRVVALANNAVLVTKSGRKVPIADSGAAIMDPQQHILGAVLVFRDVTEKRQRDEALRERDRMVALSPDAVITTDAERRIRTWNSGACDMYGWPEAEVRGRGIDELLQTRELTGALRRKDHLRAELLHTCRDGRQIVVESRQVRLRNQQGEITSAIEINRDITSRKQAEAELRKAITEAEYGRSTLHALLEHIPEGVTIADAPDARIRLVSRYGESLVGRPRESLLDIPAALHPAAWGLYRADGTTPADAAELPLVRAVERGETISDEEWIIKRPDGKSVPVLCNAAPIRDSDGRITGGLLAWRDISQRKEIEEKLRETAKLESLGVLAGGIAHDFNNLLTGIMGNASLLRETIPEGTSTGYRVQNILNAAEAASKLTQQMLAYSGRSPFITESINLSYFVHQVMTLIQASIAKNIMLQLELADDLPPVEGDVAQLQQVIMNLLINGAEAIGPEGGRLYVTTRSLELDQEYFRTLLASDQARPGLHVLFQVRDTGCGMDSSILSRIFDPFFTTKFTGRGLGLAAVLGIVRGHRGALDVTSTPGEGTTFRVFLPATNAAYPQPAERAEEQATVPGGTVLVVDDEELVRELVCSILEQLGYTVLLASSGEEAVHLFSLVASEVRLVILDMTMPGMSGEETLRELKKTRRNVKVLLSSGFSEMEVMSRFGSIGLAGFLHKPYTVRDFVAKISAVLAADH